MSQHFIFSTTITITKAAAKRIEKRIKEIDSTASFVGPLSIPGNTITGWIERPNDGTNDHSETSSRNAQIAAIAREELGI